MPTIEIISTDGTDTRTITRGKPKSVAVGTVKVNTMADKVEPLGLANAAIRLVGRGGAVLFERRLEKK